MGKGSSVLMLSNAKRELDNQYMELYTKITVKWYVLDDKYYIAHVKVPSKSKENLFYDVFDEKLKEKKYYNEIAIQTIELLKIAIHRKTYDEKKLVDFVSKVVNFSKQFKSMETAKRYYGFNTMVLYNFIDRTGEKKNG